MGNKARIYFSFSHRYSHFYSALTGGPSQCNKAKKKEIGEIQIRNKEAKASIFTDNMSYTWKILRNLQTSS